jgi:hypothetical protein
MVEPNISIIEHLKEMYEESIQDNIDHMRLISESNKTFQQIREGSKEWQIIEKCREILFDNARDISLTLKEIEDDKRKIKELS